MVAEIMSPKMGDYYMLWSVAVSTTRAVTDTTKTVTNSDRSKTDRSLPKSGCDLHGHPSVTDSDRYLRDDGPARARRVQRGRGALSVTAVTEPPFNLPEHHLTASALARVKAEPRPLAETIGELSTSLTKGTERVAAVRAAMGGKANEEASDD